MSRFAALWGPWRVFALFAGGQALVKEIEKLSKLLVTSIGRLIVYVPPEEKATVIESLGPGDTRYPKMKAVLTSLLKKLPTFLEIS